MAGRDLGRYYGFCGREDGAQNTDSAACAAVSKWELQNAARTLLPNHRVSGCHRIIGDTSKGVTVRADKQKAWFSGLAVCGSVWVCNVCARKIGEQRREELQAAIDKTIGQGGDVALLTFTFSHSIHDQLKLLQPQMSTALRYLKSGRPWQNLKAEFGIVGSVRSLEVTHGRNGWHPHVHEIEFFSTPLSAARRAQLQAMLFDLWHAACKKAGLPLPNREHGVDVRGATKAAQYVGKWGFAAELARPASKSGWSGRTPWQLLSDYALGDEMAGVLFTEFAAAFHGRRQLVWSKGLREHLQLGELFSDAELAELEPLDPADKAADVITLDCFLWALICKFERRGKVLQLALQGRDELQRWLDDLKSYARGIKRPAWGGALAPVVGLDTRSCSHPRAYEHEWWEFQGWGAHDLKIEKVFPVDPERYTAAIAAVNDKYGADYEWYRAGNGER